MISFRKGEDSSSPFLIKEEEVEMRGKMKKVFILCAFTLLFVCVSNHNASAISVLADYTFTGSAGDYLIDFTVTNNIPASYLQYVYFFGVDLAHDSSQGSPADWWDWSGTWNNQDQFGAGSNIDYLSTWKTYSNISYSIPPGGSLSGFTVHTSSIPANIHYYAITVRCPYSEDAGDGYFGDDAFWKGMNPGFEGIGGVIPEPATLSLLGLGLLGLLGLRKKRV